MTEKMERHGHRFEDVLTALKAAEGYYPVDYLIAKRGDRRGPSEYARNESYLRCALEKAKLGESDLDAVYLWLPASSATELQAVAGAVNPDTNPLQWS